MDHSAQHTTTVANMYYNTSNEYRKRIGANVLQKSVSVKAKVATLQDASEITPAYETESFFKPNWPLQLGDLPPPLEFIRKYAKSPVLNEVCHARGCNHSSFYNGDLITHMQQKHKVGEFECVCGHVSESCRAHIKHLKDSCQQQDQIPLCTSRCLEITAVRPAECPPGLACFFCSHCKTWFTTQKTAKTHLKRANDNAVKIKENKAKTLKKHGRKLAECAGATVLDELLPALTVITTNGTAVVDDTMQQRLSEERLSEEESAFPKIIVEI
jgi:hypothetical protein